TRVDVGVGACPSVHEHDDRDRRIGLLRVGQTSDILIANTRLLVNDKLPVVEKLLGSFPGRAEDAARVVANVENQSFHSILFAHGERLLEVLPGVVAEVAKGDVGGSAAEIPTPHRRNVDVLAKDLDVS